MKYDDIEAKFDSYFKFEAQRAFVTPEAAKFFAQHVATQVEERADKLQAELDALNDRINKLKLWADNQMPEAKKSALRGFGTTITAHGERKWYVGIDGVKRWQDNNAECDKSYYA